MPRLRSEAIWLVRKTQRLPWVADFRDPWISGAAYVGEKRRRSGAGRSPQGAIPDATWTGTRFPEVNLERSKICSEFAQCAAITAAAEGTSRAMPTIRRGTIIVRTPRRSWRSTRSPGVHAASGNGQLVAFFGLRPISCPWRPHGSMHEWRFCRRSTASFCRAACAPPVSHANRGATSSCCPPDPGG